MRKALILVFFGTALYFVLKNYYKNPQNTGIPSPSAFVGPTYLYAILALISDFMGGLPIAIAAGLTFALILDANKAGASAAASGSNNQSTQPSSPLVKGSGNASGQFAPVNPNSGSLSRSGRPVNPFTGSVSSLFA